MQVLLINQNATIERLVKLSSGKLGYELVSAKDILEVENGVYDFIIIDSDLYNEEEFTALKQKFSASKYILIVTKGSDRPDGFDVYVEKPFLPTELVDILSSLSSGVSQDESSIFDNADFGSTQEEPSEEAVFGDGAESILDDTLDDLDSLDDLSIDDDKPLDDIAPIENELEDLGDSEELGDLELSLDDDLSVDEPELNLDIDETTTIDEDEEPQINLDEQVGDIASEVDEIDFSSDTDELQLDELAADEPEATEDEIALGDEEPAIDTDETLEDDGLELEGLSTIEDEEPAVEEEPQIFDEDEVNKLKNLLDETEEEKVENEDFDMDNIKIQNDELGSLTEESLAEALGVNIDTKPTKIEDTSSDLDETGIADTLSLPDTVPSETEMSAAASTNIPANAIQLNPNQSITISLDALKELLNMADVTINITLSKKQ